MMKFLVIIKPPIKKIRDKKFTKKCFQAIFLVGNCLGGRGNFPGSTFPAGQISRGNSFWGFFLEPV